MLRMQPSDVESTLTSRLVGSRTLQQKCTNRRIGLAPLNPLHYFLGTNWELETIVGVRDTLFLPQGGHSIVIPILVHAIFPRRPHRIVNVTRLPEQPLLSAERLK